MRRLVSCRARRREDRWVEQHGDERADSGSSRCAHGNIGLVERVENLSIAKVSALLGKMNDRASRAEWGFDTGISSPSSVYRCQAPLKITLLESPLDFAPVFLGFSPEISTNLFSIGQRPP